MHISYSRCAFSASSLQLSLIIHKRAASVSEFCLRLDVSVCLSCLSLSLCLSR